MNDGRANPQIDSAVRINQILVAALMMGIVLFGAAMAYLQTKGSFQPAAAANAQQYYMLVAATWVATVVASIFMPRLLLGQLRAAWAQSPPEEPAREALRPWSTSVILRAALLEAPALFGVVAYMLTGHWVLLVAPAVNLLLMIATFPTRDRLEIFAEEARGQRG